MYPLTLIRLSKNCTVTLEMKNNQTVTGFLIKCDVAMNMHLQNATVEGLGQKYFVKQCFLKGPNVKSVKIDPKILSKQHLFEWLNTRKTYNKYRLTRKYTLGRHCSLYSQFRSKNRVHIFVWNLVCFHSTSLRRSRKSSLAPPDSAFLELLYRVAQWTFPSILSLTSGYEK